MRNIVTLLRSSSHSGLATTAAQLKKMCPCCGCVRGCSARCAGRGPSTHSSSPRSTQQRARRPVRAPAPPRRRARSRARQPIANFLVFVVSNLDCWARRALRWPWTLFHGPGSRQQQHTCPATAPPPPPPPRVKAGRTHVEGGSVAGCSRAGSSKVKLGAARSC